MNHISGHVFNYQFSNLKIERIGTGWRASTATDIDLSLLDINWRQASAERSDIDLLSSTKIDSVTLFLAGDESERVYRLVTLENANYLVNEQQVAFKINTQSREQLFPFTQFKN